MNELLYDFLELRNEYARLREKNEYLENKLCQRK